MESRSVKELKEACKQTHAFLRDRWVALDAAGRLDTIKEELRADMQATIDINNSVNEDNFIQKRTELTNLQEAIMAKGLYIPVEERGTAEESKPVESETRTTTGSTTGTTVVGSDRPSALRVFAGIVELTMLAGIAYHTGLYVGRAHSESYDLVEFEDDDFGTVSKKYTDELDKITNEQAHAQAAEEAKEVKTVNVDVVTEPEVTVQTVSKEPVAEANEPVAVQTVVQNVITGEYGTFFDASDYEQVMARAQYIYNTYFAPIINELAPEERVNLTVDKIADTIRCLNAQFPLDENGNIKYNGNTVITVSNYLSDYIANVPTSKQLSKFYHVPAHLFTVDGSKVSEFIKSYDDLYDKLINGLNIHDTEEIEDAIACIGYKFWNEWYLMGPNGEVNPHNFDEELKYLAFKATTIPYTTTGIPYNLNAQRPVCIDACIDYLTQELDTLSVTEIYNALNTGDWNNVAARLAGANESTISFPQSFGLLLKNELDWQYQNSQTRKLK